MLPVNVNMKSSSLLLILSTCLLVEGFLPQKSSDYGDIGRLFGNNPRLDDDLLEEITAVVGSSLDSMPLMQAMATERLPLPIVRTLMARYSSQLGLGNGMASIINGIQNREDMAQTLMLFFQMGNAMGQTILDGIQKQKQDRPYTFMIDLICNCSLHYVEEVYNEPILKGFFIDVLQEVCREANKKCVIQQAPYDRCFNNGNGTEMESIGDGILSGQFDGCIVTDNRELTNTMAISNAFMQLDGGSRFFVQSGNSGIFTPNDISGKKIGFIKGWMSSRDCLIRNKVNGAATLERDQIVYFDSINELLSSMENNEIDAAFVITYPEYDTDDKDFEMLGGTPAGLVPVGDVIYCFSDLNIGTRKDSPVVEWFDAGLKKIKESGKYALLCKNAQTEHGSRGRVDCVF